MKPTQCCFCKANSTTHKDVKFFNLELGEQTIIANGCSNCKNYAESEK